MGKLYNVQLNSASGTVINTNSNINYNIDWYSLLPKDKKFKLTFSFNSCLNYGNGNYHPYILTNILGNTYRPATNGFQNSYYLGNLKNNSQILTNFISYSCDILDNPPIYLDDRPKDNNLNVRILRNTTNTEFLDNYRTIAGSGTLTQDGFIITIVTSTAGVINIGTVITVSAITRTITQFITGNGGTGTYLCDLSATVSTATAYSFPANTTGNPISQYTLNLCFEELE